MSVHIFLRLLFSPLRIILPQKRNTKLHTTLLITTTLLFFFLSHASQIHAGSVPSNCPGLNILISPGSGEAKPGDNIAIAISGETKAVFSYRAILTLPLSHTTIYSEPASPKNDGEEVVLSLTSNNSGTWTIQILENDPTSTICYEDTGFTIGEQPIAPPPTLTPIPASKTNTIACDGGGTVITSKPHPFSPNTQDVTFTFPQLNQGTYQMTANTGIGGRWGSFCKDQEAQPDASGQYTFNCNISNPNLLKNNHKFQLQKKIAGNYPSCSPNCSGFNCSIGCLPDDGYSLYKMCEWKVQEIKTCSIKIFFDIKDKDQAGMVVSGSGLPPIEWWYRLGYFHAKFYMEIYKDKNEKKPIYTSEVETPEFTQPIDGLVDRGHNYTARIMVHKPSCASFPINGCLIPVVECDPQTEYLPRDEESPGSQGPMPTLEQAKAHQVCKSLCEQIPDSMTDPVSGDNLKKVCRDSNKWYIPDNIPVWKSDPLAESFKDALSQFIKNPDHKNLSVVQCISCFSKGGVYTAVGCIPTNASGFIKSFFAITTPIIGGILFLGIIWVGFLLITASGDPEKIQHAKDVAKSLIIGFLIFIFSVFLLDFIGRTILGIPGFNRGEIQTTQECKNIHAQCRKPCSPQKTLGKCNLGTPCCAP